MKIILTTVAVALGGFLFTGSLLQAAAPVVTAKANPYESIWERNVFGLKPPPVPPPPPPPPPPPVNLKLSGISNFKTKKALLIFTEGNGKPEYMSLAAGERSGLVEVLDIDAKNGVVQVRNGGNEILLTFEKDGNKAPAAPAPGQPGGPPASPGGANTIPAIIRPGGSTSGGIILPNQPGRQTPTGDSPQIPSRSIRIPTFAPGSPQSSARQQFGPPASYDTSPKDPDVQAVLFIANQMKDQPASDAGNAPPSIPLGHIIGEDSDSEPANPASPSNPPTLRRR